MGSDKIRLIHNKWKDERPPSQQAVYPTKDEMKLKHDAAALLSKITNESCGQKFDAGKTPWNLVDLELLEGIAKVREYGNKKYTPDSWKDVPEGKDRYFSAAMRHLVASRKERLDKESGLPHIWHAMTNLYFIEHFEQSEVENTD